MEEFLWVQKYRPRTVADTILPKDLKDTFQKFVDDKNVPNLLLSGRAGVGKTTITLGLASAAMAKGLRTLVVDLDPQCNTSTGLGAAGDYEYSVAEVLKKPRHNTVMKAIVAASWAKGQTGKLDVLLAQPRLTNLKFVRCSS